ncbi:MAG: hypothetical protein ABH876_02300 [Patescibacteria group bacterium]|nr:hypothetical protein [Patescibacteria group bacterium]MBU1877181.1 hypothetical protein [Patescibacteria group bacterium]
MEDKKIAVIGVGGRTGTMFAQELSTSAEILGITRNIDKKVMINKGKESFPLNCRIISDEDWLSNNFLPDIIFLSTKNPVASTLKYYYQKCKEKNIFPDLVLSQNGIQAGQEAIETLKEILGADLNKIRIVRVSLFNPIDRQEEDTIEVNYSLPIRISFGVIWGMGDFSDLFQKAGFCFTEFPREQVKNMEFSKLFLNLIGIASASQGLSIKEGFENRESFKEEVGSLKEYIESVKASGGQFVNFPRYPVKLLTWFISVLPIEILFLFRRFFAKIIYAGREGKPKDLSEINYYNGAVVDLGEKSGIMVPINKIIINRTLEQIKK